MAISFYHFDNVELLETEAQSITEDLINNLPTYRVWKKSLFLSPNYICELCLQRYNVGDYVKCLPCKHKFHIYCIENWLKWVGMYCPVDRTKVLRVKETVTNVGEDEDLSLTENNLIEETTNFMKHITFKDNDDQKKTDGALCFMHEISSCLVSNKQTKPSKSTNEVTELTSMSKATQKKKSPKKDWRKGKQVSGKNSWNKGDSRRTGIQSNWILASTTKAKPLKTPTSDEQQSTTLSRKSAAKDSPVTHEKDKLPQNVNPPSKASNQTSSSLNISEILHAFSSESKYGQKKWFNEPFEFGTADHNYRSRALQPKVNQNAVKKTHLISKLNIVKLNEQELKSPTKLLGNKAKCFGDIKPPGDELSNPVWVLRGHTQRTFTKAPSIFP